MRPTTNTISPRSAYLRSSRSSDSASNEGPNNEELKPSNARHELLATIPDLEIPPKGTRRTAAVHKFIEGETLSHRDSLELSEWLGEDLLQNLDLLLQMQNLTPSFVPVLDLKMGTVQQASELIGRAQGSGMRFGISVHDHLPDSLMRVLREAMTDPKSCLTSFDFSTLSFDSNKQTEAVREFLRQCIADSTALECVSGSPSVLTLIERSVRELRVRFYECPVDKFSTELRRVFQLGVEKFSLDCKDRSTDHESQLVVHQCVANAVAEANAGLPPERSVRHVVLSTRGLKPVGDITDDDRAMIVDQLFSAKHVTAITLPGPNWVPSYSLLQQKYQEGQWIQTLKSLTFTPLDGYSSEKLEEPINPDSMDWLPPILQRNTQAQLLAATYAGGAFSAAVTGHLFENNPNGHLSGHAWAGIEPLARHLGDAFASTSVAQTLTVLNKGTAKGAETGRAEANRRYQESLQVRSSVQVGAEQLPDSDARSKEPSPG